MNMKRRALGGFKHSPDDELLTRTMTVLQAMDKNAAFTDPQPDLADVGLAWRDFQEKLAIARRRGSPYDTATKNKARDMLVRLMQQLAFYVNKIADGNLQLLLSSGFLLNNYPRRKEVPDIITGVTLQEGRQSGQMRLDFQKQKQVPLYEYRYGLKPEGSDEPQWTAPLLTSSSRNNVLAPLELFQRYYVQVRAVNSLGKSPWSEAVSYIVR